MVPLILFCIFDFKSWCYHGGFIVKSSKKDVIIIFSFLSILIGTMIINIIKPDKEFSFSERRKLAQAPVLTLNNFYESKTIAEFEKYTMDQFVFRDHFRSIKAYFVYNILNQKDNNGIYFLNGSIHKIDYPLNEKSIYQAASKFNYINQKYLKDLDDIHVYYSLIPDKNYFLAKEYGYLSINYNQIEDILKESLKDMKYIDIFDLLSIEDYYLTDLHWKQEKIIDVADKLLTEMGNKDLPSSLDYEEKTLYPFYGSYYGQGAVKVKADKMIYLNHDMLDKTIVRDHESKESSKVYDLDEFASIDSYNIYLSGAKPLLTLYKESNDSNKELIIFRDSFASSIAPLLLPSYKKITLVDIRYISSDLLDSYISFKSGQDILFLYNTQILNNSYMLK